MLSKESSLARMGVASSRRDMRRLLASVLVSVVMSVGLTTLNSQQRGSHCPQSDLCCKTPCCVHVVYCFQQTLSTVVCGLLGLGEPPIDIQPTLARAVTPQVRRGIQTG